MLKRFAFLFAALLLVLVPIGCSSSQGNNQPTAEQPAAQPAPSAEKAELMISAAASLTDALNELKTSFETEHPNITLTYNFGSSGKLAQQIEQGAPTDLFLSASKKDMDKLQEKEQIVKDSRVDFAKNELVLIAGSNSTLAISSFEQIDPAKVQHFAIGEPESVPAGRYTKEVFENLKLWDKLKSKFVLGSDVRQVLTYVESGNADAGVVYSSDAVVAKNVKVLATAKPEWHKPIVYPGAVVAASKHQEEAKAFLAYLTSDKGKEVLKKYGFVQ